MYEIVPKLLVWIIIDEVDLDLHCGVRANTHRRVSPDPLHQLLFKLSFLELYHTNLTFLFILQSKITLPNTD